MAPRSSSCRQGELGNGHRAAGLPACERVNTREHRVARGPAAVMLQEECERLHPLPGVPHTVCFGQTRKVSWQSTISVGSAI